MTVRSRVKVSQYAAALIVVPGGMKSTRIMAFLSQKMHPIFLNEFDVLKLLVLGEGVWLLGFRNVVKNPCFISSHNGVQKLISFLCVAREKLQRRT